MCSARPERIANFTDASHVVGELRAEIAELAEFAKATIPRVEAAASNADLEELADKTARGLAMLALAIVEMRQKPQTRRKRVAAWFRANVYGGMVLEESRSV